MPAMTPAQRVQLLIAAEHAAAAAIIMQDSLGVGQSPVDAVIQASKILTATATNHPSVVTKQPETSAQ